MALPIPLYQTCKRHRLIAGCCARTAVAPSAAPVLHRPEASGSLFAPTARPTRPILDWPRLRALAGEDRRAPLTALDTETTSLDPFAARIVGISWRTSRRARLLHPASPRLRRRAGPVAA
jgi:hypothetical protein